MLRRSDPVKRSQGRPRTVPDWKINYILRAVKLHHQLTLKAVAQRLGLSYSTVKNYANGRYKGGRNDRSNKT